MFNKCPPDPLPDEHLKVAIVKQCEENNLEGTAHFLSKVQQLYDMMDLSDGVIVLGNMEIVFTVFRMKSLLKTLCIFYLGDSYGGKTMATKMLAASLQAVAGEGKKALTCVILNPKAMQIEQLYGHFDKDEWRVSNLS